MVGRLLSLFSLVPGGFVMADSAADGGAHHAVVARHVAGDAANGGTLETTRGARVNRGQRHSQGYYDCRRSQDFLHLDAFPW
jgi:hypothetical protein